METFTMQPSQVPRCWRTMSKSIKVILTAWMLFFFSFSGSAQTIDGNPNDWPALLAAQPSFTTKDLLNGGNTDDQFTNGTSDMTPLPEWRWTLSSMLDKDDLGNVGAALRTVNGEQRLYFFADRYAANGTADLGIWIFQSAVSLNPDGTFNGNHTVGDILITSKFTNGGGVVAIKAYRWNGTSLVELTLDAAQAIAFVNDQNRAVPAGWSYTSKFGPANNYPAGTFFEGYIVLGGSNQLNVDVCNSVFLFRTSTSDQLTSANKDLVFGTFQSVPETKTLQANTICSNAGNTGMITMANSQVGISYQLKDATTTANVQAPQNGNGGTITWSNLAAGSYYVMATNTATTCSLEIGRPTPIGVNNVNPGSISGGGTGCAPFDPAAFGSVAATGSGAITYQWQMSTTSDAAGFSNIAGATNATYDAPAVAQQTWYRRIATSTLNGVECNATSNVVTAVPNNVTAGSISGGGTFCGSADPEAFTVTTAATGSGTLTYQWQSNTTGCDGAWTNIAGATNATYDAPAGIAVTTYFRRVVTSTLNGVQCTANSNCITVTVGSASGGEIAGGGTGCAPFDPAAFTSVTAGSGPAGAVITYRWESSTTSNSTGFTTIAGATNATYDAPVVAQQTWYRRVTISTLNGVPCEALSNVLAVTPNSINPGSISGGGTGCAPFDPAAFGSVAATGSGAITYQWQMSTTSDAAGFSNIAGATNSTYDAPAVAQQTWYRRIATSTLNGVPCNANSNVITVIPNNVTAGSISGGGTGCAPFDPAAFTSVTAGSGPAGAVITYRWESSTTSNSTGFTTIAGATNATYDAPVVAQQTWYRRVTISTLNGVPCEALSNVLAVTPNNVTPGTIAGSQTLCIGGNPEAFTVTTAATGSGTLTYQWQSNTTGCDGAWTNIAGATNATYDAPAGIAVTTYFRRVVTSTLNGVQCTANSNCITVTVTPCAITYCTYTQGYYGNSGGKSCTPAGEMSTAQLIAYSLSKMPGGQLYIGRPGKSFTVRNSDISDLISVLPGGGPSAVLGGNYYPSTVQPLQKGKIRNSLLAQTTVLGLNLYITNSLQNFELRSGMDIYSYGKASGSGCDVNDINMDPCNVRSTRFHEAVVKYLQENKWNGSMFVPNAIGDPAVATVSELFELASAVLGGVTRPSVMINGSSYQLTLEDISSVADNINNLFDGCRIFNGYGDPLVCPVDVLAVSADQSNNTESLSINQSVISKLNVMAAPNPFTDRVRFTIASPVSGYGSLEVFNTLGQKVQTVFQGHVNAGVQRIDYTVPSSVKSNLIYVFRVEGHRVTGKLMSGK